MFALLLQLKRRIRRLLKVTSESREAPRPTTQSQTTKFLLLLLAAVLVATLYPGEDLYDPLDVPREGEIAPKDFIAPFQITVKKTSAELSDEREIERLSVPLVIEYDTAVVASTTRNIEQFFTTIRNLQRVREQNDTLTIDSAVQELSQRYPLLSESALRQSLQVDSPMVVAGRLSDIFRDVIYSVGVLPDAERLPANAGKSTLIRRGNRENVFPLQRVMARPVANARLLTELNRLSTEVPFDVEYYYSVGRTFIQPNLRFNAEEYRDRLNARMEQITEVKETVKAGELIVRSGTKVSADQHRKLQEWAKLMRAQATEEGWLTSILPVIARILLVLAAFSVLYTFLYFFRREVFNSNPKMLAILIVFAIQLFLVNLASDNIGMYLWPVAMLPIMLTILFDAEVSLLSLLTLSVLLGILHRFDFTLTLLTITAGTVGCIAARRVRNRSNFIRIMAATAATTALFVFAVENFKLTPAEDITLQMAYGLGGGALAGALAFVLMPFFESLFGITTDITLLELSDLNHPLLRRLSMEAPGSYHHSLTVGTLTEAGAKAIGANSLLARVGAYYHDIGKMEIPDYFVENQLSVKSKHEMLTPTMSSLVLSSHVKKGRIIGEAAGIPDDVLNFIEEHHGTMVQSYFYNKAVEQGADPADIDKFRYPGPKPQTRETGIAMLADAVEAASRTLEDPKPARIHNLIQRIINDRFQSGELDECPLTLRDLARIREAFAQVLIASFHQRIVYPKKSPAETKA